MTNQINGRQIHEAGSILAKSSDVIDIGAGGWAFTFTPAESDSTGFARVNEDLREATIEISATPPVHDAVIADTVAILGGLIGLTLYSTHRAVGSGFRLLTYTVINSNAA